MGYRANAEDATEEDDKKVEEDIEETDDTTDEEVESDESEGSEEDAAGEKVRKKVAALRARHAIEDYFENKKIRHELDYLLDEAEKAKAKVKKKDES